MWASDGKGGRMSGQRRWLRERRSSEGKGDGRTLRDVHQKAKIEGRQ